MQRVYDLFDSKSDFRSDRRHEHLPNCNIASAYIQAHRIASKVIQEKGNNSFCGAGGDLHCGVRNNFIESEEGGLMRKDKAYCGSQSFNYQST
jgi:hypothetical protein